MENRQEYMIKRAIAVRQYRFLLKCIRTAQSKRFYALAAQYRIEAEQLRRTYNL
jgi:hypothetical protein